MRGWVVLCLWPLACVGEIGPSSPNTAGPPTPPGPTGPSGRPSVPELPAVGACGGEHLGRSYVSVFGPAREADRVDYGLGFERDVPVINTRWYQLEIEDRLYGVFESYPHGELFRPEGVLGTFNGVRRARSFARFNQGPLSSVKLFEISFNLCLLEIGSRRGYSLWDHDRYQAAPTEPEARTFCQRVLTHALQRAPHEPELESCVAYATVDVAADPVPARQWAYVCGMIGATTMSWTR